MNLYDDMRKGIKECSVENTTNYQAGDKNDTLSYACEEAIKLAKRENKLVEFIYNNVVLEVNPASETKDVIDTYNTICEIEGI